MHTLFYDIICSHFCGLLSCNTLPGDTCPPGTRDLALLRLVMLQMFAAPAVLGGFKTKTTSWAHFRRPSSSSSSSRSRPLHTTAATTTHGYGWLHRGSSSLSSSSKSASTATLFQWSFSFSRPMKIGTIFVSPPPGLFSFLLAPFLITNRKIDLLLLVDHLLPFRNFFYFF